jgi:hypothetical protein
MTVKPADTSRSYFQDSHKVAATSAPLSQRGIGAGGEGDTSLLNQFSTLDAG